MLKRDRRRLGGCSPPPQHPCLGRVCLLSQLYWNLKWKLPPDWKGSKWKGQGWSRPPPCWFSGSSGSSPASNFCLISGKKKVRCRSSPAHHKLKIRAGKENLPLTWVGQDLFSWGNVNKLLLRLLFLHLWLEVVRVPLLCQLPVSLDDLLLVGTPKQWIQRGQRIQRGLSYKAQTASEAVNGYLLTPRIL